MSRAARISIVLALLAGVVVLVVFTAFSFLGTEPATVTYVSAKRTGVVHLVMQTNGLAGTGAHPTWVTYDIQDPHTGKWVHTTLVKLPAHTRILVTIYQFDSASVLRNPVWKRVTGTTGGIATVDGVPFRVLSGTAGHTFTIPSLNVNVPLRGVKTTAKNFCTKGPCDPATQSHATMRFSITTPGPGSYRFQCFIPCGGGFYAGNGGPMQTIGYMGGFLEVV